MTSSETATVVLLSLRCAIAATALIVVFGLPLAWLLARRNWPGKSIVETLVALPLVIPPVATGLILLRLFGRRGIGEWVDVVFTWRAVVIAMTVMSFPLFVRTARVAIEQVSERLENVARTLGASDWRVFTSVTLPLARGGIIAGALLAFARALGEFGATILVAGNIPGETSTIAVSIYNLVELGREREALRLIAISVSIAFVAVWISDVVARRKR